MDLAVQKSSIRNTVRAACADLSVQDCELAGVQVAEQLSELLQNDSIDCVALYAAAAHELSLEPLAEQLRAADVCVVYPRVLDNERMEFAMVTDPAQLKPGYQGILEPEPSCPTVTSDSIDCVCVPGVAFDQNGHRLGRGAGYYDRWLAQFTGTSIGVAYGCQIVEHVPAEAHDEPMDYLVSPVGLTQCTPAKGVM